MFVAFRARYSCQDQVIDNRCSSRRNSRESQQRVVLPLVRYNAQQFDCAVLDIDVHIEPRYAIFASEQRSYSLKDTYVTGMIVRCRANTHDFLRHDARLALGGLLHFLIFFRAFHSLQTLFEIVAEHR